MANVATAFLELVATDKISESASPRRHRHFGEDASHEPQLSDLAPEGGDEDGKGHARMRPDSWIVKHRG